MNENTKNNKLESAADLAVRYAYGISLKINLAIFSCLLFLIYAGTFWLHSSQLQLILNSASKSVAASINLGDLFQVKRTLASLVDGRIVWGVWVFEPNQQEIISGQSSNSPDLGIVFGPNSPTVSIGAGRIFLVARHDLQISNGRIVGNIVAVREMPAELLMQIFLSILLAFAISTWFFSRKFRTVGETFAKPITEFARALQSAESLKTPIVEPVEHPYYEIGDLYQKYRSFIDKSLMAEKLEKEAAIGRIITGLGHDLRAPLNIFERLLVVSADEFENMRQPIRDSLYRLYAMIEALRFVDRESLVNIQPIRINWNAVFEILQNKASLAQRRILFSERPDIIVRVDAMSLERAVINLGSNAIDFAKTYVRIEVTTQYNTLVVQVIDDGPGVPDEFLPRLFQRGATHGKHDGTGLGLAYVRQIMRGHGGDVTYRRENDLTILECRLPNAVEVEKGQVVENALSLEIQPLQKQVRVVAICLDPESLSRSVLAKMTSHNSDEFLFIEERREAHIVVSNVEDIMIEVLEADDKEFISVGQLKGDENRIVDILKRKFNLA